MIPSAGAKRQRIWVGVLIATLGTAASAWDPTGHMLVGQIAWARTTPAARQRVSELVAKIDNQFNENRPYNFITAGCWMDDMRAAPDYAYSLWHYVDMPFTPTGTPIIEPPAPHVLTAIDEVTATLKRAESPVGEKANAVAMLMHLIGDLHQPLHCTDWNDKGGNAYGIQGIPFSDLMKRQGVNLHTFWDKAFRFDATAEKGAFELYQAPITAERPDPETAGVIRAEAEKIMARFPPESLFQLDDKKDHRGWARESHLIGCLFTYPTRPHPVAGEKVTLAPDYVQRAGEICNQRIALAGYRLALILNELFGAE